MTAVETYGETPPTWWTGTLGELCALGGGEIQTGPFGSQLHASAYVPVGVPTIMPVNIGDNRVIERGVARITEADADRLSRHRCQPGDIVYSRRGDVERRALIRGHERGWLCGTGCLRVRVGDGGADPRYVSFMLGHPRVRAWITQHAVGATMANLNTAILSAVPAALPPIEDQRAIADVLEALDDKVESNRRLGDAIGMMLDAEFLNATAGLDDAPAASALVVEMGSPFSGALFSDPGNGRPLIRIRDLKTFEPQVWTTERRSDEHVVTAGDVLVGMDAEFRSSLWMSTPGVLNQRVCRFRPKEGVARAFALLAIRPDLALFERAKSGTTVIHLNKSDIGRFTVPHLSAEQHRRYSDATEPLVSRWVSGNLESSSLTELRDTLLPELLSGRLRVPVAEELVEAGT